MQKRRRFRHSQSPEERLADEAMRLREQASTLPPCTKKEALLRKARHDETTAHLTEWLMSLGLRMPL
ncbi:hypothetical protein [Bradyrhizobium sp. 6(2017)]|uniref:hypothetical protein n=1 Tax=Bradyrhizobium sp. 6(2017) TaxID=1197460 RepID=UPI00048FA859|nr:MULTISPECIES: hypothetical protein [unclassified Bradyrhizobium]